MLRRTSSFKRKVKSGQSASQSDAPNKILIKGDAKISHQAGSKGVWTRGKSGYVVAYAGVDGGLTIAWHKSSKDFTAFRAFPEDVAYLGRSRIIAEVLAEAAPGVPAYCLQLEGDETMSQPSLLLSFASRDELAAWSKALQPTAVKADEFWRNFAVAPQGLL